MDPERSPRTSDPSATARPSVDGGDLYADGRARRSYFRQLRRVLLTGLFLAYLIPITILTVYFNYRLDASLRESANLHLLAVAETQRNTIALFFHKRIVNIFNLFHLRSFTLTPTQQEMDSYLATLTGAGNGFVDIGLLSPEGIQVGYAGPYPHLLNDDYSREAWYVELTTGPQSYVVTDLYLGLRRVPHFTIGVKQSIDGQDYVVRASLDPKHLHGFLTTTRRGKPVHGFLINRDGLYQAVSTDFGELLAPAAFIPPRSESVDPAQPPSETGEVGETQLAGERILVAHAWLKEVPWCLVMWQPRDLALREMRTIRNSMIAGSAALVMALMIVIWQIVKRVIRWAESLEHDRAELRTQLYHAHKLVAVGQLAGGVAHEINNPLAIIATETGLIRDMLDGRLGMDASPAAIEKELDEIDKAVYRTKSITQKILSFVRRTEPRLAPCDVRPLLEDVVTGLRGKEFVVSNIAVVQDFAADTPQLLLDPDLIRQVFLNLINNASDALADGGTITIRTRLEDGWLRVTVADDGVGMDAEQVSKAFMPFYTTKDVGKGTGLGLPISQNIVEGFGGRIEVESKPGVGSAFTVVLPVSARGS